MRRVVENIEILDDPEQIANVMDYYRTIDEIQQFVESFESSGFADLPMERRRKAVLHWIDQQERVARLGHKALDTLARKRDAGLFTRPR